MTDENESGDGSEGQPLDLRELLARELYALFHGSDMPVTADIQNYRRRVWRRELGRVWFVCADDILAMVDGYRATQASPTPCTCTDSVRSWVGDCPRPEDREYGFCSKQKAPKAPPEASEPHREAGTVWPNDERRRALGYPTMQTLDSHGHPRDKLDYLADQLIKKRNQLANVTDLYDTARRKIKKLRKLVEEGKDSLAKTYSGRLSAVESFKFAAEVNFKLLRGSVDELRRRMDQLGVKAVPVSSAAILPFPRCPRLYVGESTRQCLKMVDDHGEHHMFDTRFPEADAKCSAHGAPGCELCHRNPADCASSRPRGCDAYSLTGMHWDTCPNRIKIPLSSAFPRLLD